LRRSDDFQSLSVSIARDIHDSYGGPSEAKILAPTLGRLSVSTPLGEEELLPLFQSQPTRVGFREGRQNEKRSG